MCIIKTEQMGKNVDIVGNKSQHCGKKEIQVQNGRKRGRAMKWIGFTGVIQAQGFKKVFQAL